MENIILTDREPALKRGFDPGDLECTELFALFHFLIPDKRSEFNLSMVEKYLLTAPKFTDETMAKKYEPLLGPADKNLGAPAFNFNIPYIIFELLPQCRRVKTKDIGEAVPDRLKDYIIHNPEYLFKCHLLECYYTPTSGSFCYASLYDLLRSQVPKKEMPLSLVEHLYRILEVEKKVFYSGNRPAEHILVLLHYLIQLFIYFPVKNIELLKKFYFLCLEFRLLPKPYGMLADEFVQLLQNEMRCFCTALLYKIREDFPSIDIYTSSAKESKYTETYEAHLLLGIVVPKRE